MWIRPLALTAALLAGCNAAPRAASQPRLGSVQLKIAQHSLGPRSELEVFVDGEFIGHGSMTFSLEEGPHIVRVACKQHGPAERQIQVLPGPGAQVLWLHAD